MDLFTLSEARRRIAQAKSLIEDEIMSQLDGEPLDDRIKGMLYCGMDAQAIIHAKHCMGIDLAEAKCYVEGIKKGRAK